MKIHKIVLAVSSAFFALNTYAATGFKVPVHYNIELVDGSDDTDNYSRFNRILTLTPGKHQVVLTFKDAFKSGTDSRMVQSIDPLVIDIENLKNDEVISFNYKRPANEEQAKTYAHNQKIVLIDNNSGRELTKDEATYFILTSDSGFALMRDYKNELMSLNRLYAPSYVPNAQREMTLTENGAPTIRAGSERNANYQVNGKQGITLKPLANNSSAMTTSSAPGSKVNADVYNEMIRLYNQADDATKLKFVKYVMSH